MSNFYLAILTDIKFENNLLYINVHHTTRGMTYNNVSPFCSAITATNTTTFFWDRLDLSILKNHIIFVDRNRIPRIVR